MRAMIYSLAGKLIKKDSSFFVVSCGGVGYKVSANQSTLFRLPEEEKEISVFCSLYIRDEQMELYGFLEEESLKLFELLRTVSGVGPKTALGVLDVDTVPNIITAIIERRPDLLSRAPGIGKKTAERLVLELQNKMQIIDLGKKVGSGDKNGEVEDVLVGLGYSRYKVRNILGSLPQNNNEAIESRLKAALKELGK